MPKIAIVNDNDEIIGAAEKSEARKEGQIHTKGAERIRRFNMVFVAQADPNMVHPDLTEIGGIEWFTKSQIAQMIHDEPDHFSSGLREHYSEIVGKLL